MTDNLQIPKKQVDQGELKGEGDDPDDRNVARKLSSVRCLYIIILKEK